MREGEIVRRAAVDDQGPPVKGPVVRKAERDQPGRIVAAALGPEVEVMKLEVFGGATTGDRAAAVLAPKDQPAGRGRDRLGSRPVRGGSV
jgi:hypothetical protein